jgi:hypothetical protein
MQPDEAFLEDVLGRAFVVRDTQGRSVDQRSIFFEQPPQGVEVSLLQLKDEPRFVRSIPSRIPTLIGASI